MIMMKRKRLKQNSEQNHKHEIGDTPNLNDDEDDGGDDDGFDDDGSDNDGDDDADDDEDADDDDEEETESDLAQQSFNGRG